jgi:hypothetical protein
MDDDGIENVNDDDDDAGAALNDVLFSCCLPSAFTT